MLNMKIMTDKTDKNAIRYKEMFLTTDENSSKN